MTVAASLGRDFDLAEQILWASRFALLRGQPLLLYCRVLKQAGQWKAVEVPLAKEPDGDEKEIIQAVQAAIRESPGLRNGSLEEGADAAAAEGTPVRLRLLYSADQPLQALFAELRASKVALLVGVRRELDPDTRESQVRRELFRHAPCELAFVRPGASEGGPCTNLLVAVGHGPHGRVALRLAQGLAEATSARMTALRVSQDVGADTQAVGEHLLGTLIQRALGKNGHEIARRVVVDNNVYRGVTQACADGGHDVLIVGASKLGALGQRLLGTVGGKLIRGVPQATVIITRAANPLTSRFGRGVERFLQRLVPQLDRESRIALVERVQPTSQVDFDYLALITLSSVIAAIGLVQGSAAVVIGAMLVAPLMTPILGLGIALVQGNPIFARMTIRSIFLGFAVALSSSWIVGMGSRIGHFDQPTTEMLARGGPGLLDMFVAFASGVAAAYASSRPTLLAALPGVAIAAALVPPIATAGLSLSIGEHALAIGATLLFVINTVMIVFAAQVTLWAVGLRNVKSESRLTSWVGGAVNAGVLSLALYLSMAPPNSAAAQLLPDPSRLVGEINRVLAEWPAYEGKFALRQIDLSYDVQGYELIVRVTGPQLVPEGVSAEVLRIARAALDEPVKVRVVTQYEIK